MESIGPMGYCDYDKQGPDHTMIVRIRNNGAPAPATVTTVDFGGKSVTVNTPAFSKGFGEVQELRCQEPKGVWQSGDLSFTIKADSTGVVTESNEDNNIAKGMCLG
jgi:hypothetical protein